MKKFCVLDVEGYSNCKPYDVGFQIVDKMGTVYEQHSIAILPAIPENLTNYGINLNVFGLKSANEMAHKNITEILTDCDGKYEKYYNIDKFFVDFVTCLYTYDIRRIWAYNCSFDKAALHRLFGDEKFENLSQIVEFCDIIPAILHTYLINKEYIDFCKVNKFITEKGNIQTKAEVVYKFLTGNINFVEAHTGLEDVQIETFILLKAMEKSNSPKRKSCQAWKILKKFCEVEEIEIPNPSKEKEKELLNYCKEMETLV